MRILSSLVFVIMIAIPAAAINIPDFQVSEDNYTGVFQQTSVSCDRAGDGHYVVCWRDGREGGEDIYYQLFTASGQPIGANRKANTGYTNYGLPRAAMNDNGEFAIICGLTGNGQSGLSVLRFDADGNQSGEPVDIFNTGEAVKKIGVMAIDLNNQGHIIAVYRAERASDNFPGLWGQHLDFTDGPVGQRFLISETYSPNADKILDIAIDEQDHIFGTYSGEDISNPNWQDEHIVFYRFEFGSTTLSADMILDDEFVITDQLSYGTWTPTVTCHPGGRVAVVWSGNYYASCGSSCWTYLAGSDTTFIQIFDQAGNTIAARSPIAHQSELGSYYMRGEPFFIGDEIIVPFIMTSDSMFVMVKSDLDGAALPPTQCLSADYGDNPHDLAVIPTTGDRIAMVWRSEHFASEYYYDVFSEGFHLDGSAAFERRLINDDKGAVQMSPVVAADGQGNSLMLWIDYRRSWFGSVYGQRYNAVGNKIGDNFLIYSSDIGIKNLRLSCNDNGRAVAVWCESRLGGSRLWRQIFTSPDFTPVGPPELMIETESKGTGTYPDVAVSSDNTFVVAWRNYQPDSDRLSTYVRRYFAGGNPLSEIIKVNESEGNTVTPHDYAPRLAMRLDGSFGVLWIEYTHLFFQQFYGDCNPMGSNVHIETGYRPSNYYAIPDLACNEAGQFGAVWMVRLVTSNGVDMDGVWFIGLDNTGTPSSIPIRCNISEDGDEICGITTGPDGNFLAYWHDSYTGQEDIWAQKMNATGNFIGYRTRINTDRADNMRGAPYADISGSTVIFAWQDERNAPVNPDIYSHFMDWWEFDGFVCGDVNADAAADVGDIVFLINYIFKGGIAPISMDAGDANGDGQVSVADAVYLVNFVFKSGPDPVCP